MEATGSRVIFYGKEDAQFKFWAIGDVHRFARGMALDHFKRDVETIRSDPYSYWTGVGDYCDWIVPADKRFDPASFDEEVRVIDLSSFAAYCARQIIKDYHPIKNKCLGFGIGNHDLKYLTKNSEIIIHHEICRELGVPNLAYSGWFDIYFVYLPGSRVALKVLPPPTNYQARLRVLCFHGKGASATAGGKMNALKQVHDIVDADLIMTGHLHEEIAKKFTRLYPNKECKEIASKTTIGLITGSYLRTYAPDYTSYGEQKGYFPTTLGASYARYTPKTKRLSVEIAAEGVGLGPVKGGKE